MTKKEAISWLIAIAENEGNDIPIYEEDVEAIEMAIKALKEERTIEIDGKRYIAEDPKLKTIHKNGEVVIGGFREVEE